MGINIAVYIKQNLLFIVGKTAANQKKVSMKNFLLVLLLGVAVQGFSQLKSYTLSVHGDTLNRVDAGGLKQGPWIIRVENLRGERGYEEEGYFQDDTKQGTWKRYSLENGVKIAEENYKWGKLHGKSKYYTYNGGLVREESWRAMDPGKKFDTVALYDVNDPNKEINRIVVKNEGLAVKHGKWVYYDPVEGVVVETETYALNKLVNADGSVTGEDEIKPIGLTKYTPSVDSLGKKNVAKPQAIMDFEKKNSGKKKVKVRDGSTGM